MLTLLFQYKLSKMIIARYFCILYVLILLWSYSLSCLQYLLLFSYLFSSNSDSFCTCSYLPLTKVLLDSTLSVQQIITSQDNQIIDK